MAESRKRKGGKRDEEKKLEVVCRIAPYRGTNPCVIALDDQTVRFVPPEGLMRRNGEAYEDKIYEFANVFDGYDTQRDVFNRCALDFVGDLVSGRNSLLFTYGVTGSGKTYTMTGKCVGDESGILPRAADVIFNSLPKLADKCVFYPDGRNGFAVRSLVEAARERLNCVSPPRYEMKPRTPEIREVPGFPSGWVAAVFVSYVEIYNDYCYDLLDDSLTDNRIGESRDVRTPVDGPAYVDRLTEVEVQSSDEVLLQYMKAQERRKVSKTLLNHKSSRSHSIFTIRLVMAQEDEHGQPITDGSKVISSQMSLVDLAGSERVKRTGNTGDRFAETCNINKSLLALRQCFESLRKNQSHRRKQVEPVPYRDQKLTLLFKTFFEGHGRIRMIICLNPQPSDYEENDYVLEFAKKAKTVDIPESSAPDLPLGEMGNLPYRRRDILRWYGEMDQIVDPEPMDMEIFDEPPQFKLDDPRDENSIRRLREYYTNRIIQREQYITTVRHNASELTTKLKQRLCYSDLDRRRLEELKDEVEELRQYSRENNALKVRVGRYEGEETNERRRDEEARLREEKLLAEHRRAQQQLDKLLYVVESPVTSAMRTPTATFAPIQQCPSTSRVASLRKQFDQDSPSTPVRPAGGPPRRDAAYTEGALTSSMTTHQSRSGRAFANERYQRRSLSASGKLLSHEPVNKVPLGTICQPNLPKGTLYTTRPEMKDLRKCDEYMLMNQSIDDDGILRSAVIIKDVEKLHQEPPTRL
ncbi:Kinesin motor domain containing protein [Aphelenchoides avenae]|nr:Kinesin motor domain containing protein [Aphelenchus avenae]